jgi:hypothetical protein
MQASVITWEPPLADDFIVRDRCGACGVGCRAEFGEVFATGICEVADEVLPGDIYCCVERIQVRLHNTLQGWPIPFGCRVPAQLRTCMQRDFTRCSTSSCKTISSCWMHVKLLERSAVGKVNLYLYCQRYRQTCPVAAAAPATQCVSLQTLTSCIVHIACCCVTHCESCSPVSHPFRTSAGPVHNRRPRCRRGKGSTRQRRHRHCC